MPNNLLYTINQDTSSCTNILLVDGNVLDYQNIINSVNTDTFPIVYSTDSSRGDLDELLSANFTTIDRMGVCFISNGNIPKIFLNNESFQSSGNIDQMIAWIHTYSIQNLDFITSLTANYSQWVVYYNTLTVLTNVRIHASSDCTGNTLYGGNWLMCGEGASGSWTIGDGEDIKLIYFTILIENYKYLLNAVSGTSLFIASGGGVLRAGYDESGENENYNARTFVQVPVDNRATIIACGYRHSVMITEEGTMWGMGSNKYGQLGFGAGTDDLNALTLIPLPSGHRAVAVACGWFHTIVLMEGGTVWGMGLNIYGQLGTGNLDNVRTLTLVLFDHRVTAVTCGADHTVILTESGETWSTGYNVSGQLGIDNTTNQNTLQRMLISSEIYVVQISSGWFHTIVLTDSGVAHATGLNNEGQLGTGTTTNTSILTQMIIPSGYQIQTISGGDKHSVIQMRDSTVWGVGGGFAGQLGIGSLDSKLELTRMPMPSGHRAIAVLGGGGNTMVMMSDQTLWGTGFNEAGQLGIGSLNDCTMLTRATRGNSLISNCVAIVGTIYRLLDVLIQSARMLVFHYKMSLLFKKLHKFTD